MTHGKASAFSQSASFPIPRVIKKIRAEVGAAQALVMAPINLYLPHFQIFHLQVHDHNVLTNDI